MERAVRREAAARQEVAAAVAASSGNDSSNSNLSEQRRLLAELNAKVDEAKRAIERQKKENTLHQAVVKSLTASSERSASSETTALTATQGT